MAYLIFYDDEIKEVDYNQAAAIYQILIGNKEPENEKQANYASQVKDVVFEKPGGGYTTEDRHKLRGLKKHGNV